MRGGLGLGAGVSCPALKISLPLVFTLALACLVGPRFLAAAESPPSLPAASLTELVARAGDAAEKKEWPLVRNLAEIGLELDGANSDLRYLAAQSLLGLGEGAAAALPELEAGLEADRFVRYFPRQALLLKAKLLQETHRFAEALQTLSPPGPEAPFESDYFLIRAKAFYGLGRPGEARRQIAEGSRRFPLDPRFARLFFEREAAPPAEDARSLGDYFLRRLPELSETDAEMPLLAQGFIPDATRRRDLLLGFRAQGGGSGRSTILALEAGLLSPTAAVGEFFRTALPLRLGELEDLSRALESDPDHGGLASLLAGLDGILEADRDGDGIPDEKARYAAGSLQSWGLDADQDGRDELELSFREGLPVSALIRQGMIAIEVAYSVYPWIESLRFSDLSPARLMGSPVAEVDRPSPRRYRFGPEILGYRPLDLLPFPGPLASFYLPRPVPAAVPLEQAALVAALEVRRVLPEYEELVFLDHGIPLRRERYREGRLFARLEYRQGLAQTELLDLDGDGRFEVLRRYAGEGGEATLHGDGDDAIVSVSVDADGDGFAEYQESFRPPFRKQWDYNGDGLSDAVETKTEDGFLRREFSSRLDGELDEVLIFEPGGRLISAEREGESLVLVPDANPRLRWIGEKPFDLGSNLPASEGVYRYMGRRYRLIVVGSEAFAELIP